MTILKNDRIISNESLNAACDLACDRKEKKAIRGQYTRFKNQLVDLFAGNALAEIGDINNQSQSTLLYGRLGEMEITVSDDGERMHVSLVSMENKLTFFSDKTGDGGYKECGMTRFSGTRPALLGMVSQVNQAVSDKRLDSSILLRPTEKEKPVVK